MILITLNMLSSCILKDVNEETPNVIFILADDLGYAELGSYGNNFNNTPFIDSLAMNGVLFTNAYASAPVCSPYRASLMTGQHPGRLGITDYLRPHGDEHLDENLITIAEMFQQKGYQTGMIGKWHLSGYEKNGAKASPPENHGFNEVILTEKRGISGGSYNYPYHFNQEVEQKIFPEEYLTDRVNLEAVEFIERNKDKPFFLYKSHYSVHTNLNGKASLVNTYNSKPNAGLSPESKSNNVHLASQLESVDQGLEMIIKKLEQHNLLDNTLLIFTSDNGGETNVTSNAPLRDGKSTLYEGGIRIPLIMHWPKKIRHSKKTTQVTTNMDFFPMFKSLLKIEVEQEIDGTEILMDVVNNKENAANNTKQYWHYPLEAPHFLGGFSSGAVRDGYYKLLENYTSGKLELYNLKNDLGENTDLGDSQSKIRDSLYTSLQNWRQRLGLKAQAHSKVRKQALELPEPSGPEITLNTGGKEVPYLNYGVAIKDNGTFVFNGEQNFLKLLPLYIPDVTAKGVELSATVLPKTKDGVIIAHGEEVFGLALYMKTGKVLFSIRKYGKLFTIASNKTYSTSFKVLGKLSKKGIMSLTIDGVEIGTKDIGESLPIPPDDPYSIGMDFRRLIGDYGQDNFFKGELSEINFITN